MKYDLTNEERLTCAINYADNLLDEVFAIVALLRDSASNDQLDEWRAEKALNGVLTLVTEIQEYIEITKDRMKEGKKDE